MDGGLREEETPPILPTHIHTIPANPIKLMRMRITNSAVMPKP
jgi:hypothetical protein